MRHTIITRCMAAVLCAVLLTGCMGPEDQAGGEVFIEPGTETPREEKILRFFAPVDSRSTGAIAYRKLIDQYNASQSEVHVVFEGVATADGFNRYLEERLDAGEGDDVFIINEDSVKPLHAKGYLYDLSGLPTYQKLNRAAKEEALIGDIAYCIPVNMTAYALYVNLEVLAQYQLQPPENLQEFMASCRTIREAGGIPISISRWHATAVPTIANGLWQVYGSRQTPVFL